MLTAVMIAAQLVGWTRLDLPLLLVTIVTEDPDRARVVGFFIHLAVGEGFAFGYAAGFALLDTATWWLGALLGLVHVALTILVPLLPACIRAWRRRERDRADDRDTRHATHRQTPASSRGTVPRGSYFGDDGYCAPLSRSRPTCSWKRFCSTIWPFSQRATVQKSSSKTLAAGS